MSETFAFQPFRVTVPCDLTETSFLEAYGRLAGSGTTPGILVACIEDAEEARRLAEKYDVDCVLLPGTVLLGRDGWALAGGQRVIWSPGA